MIGADKSVYDKSFFQTLALTEIRQQLQYIVFVGQPTIGAITTAKLALLGKSLIATPWGNLHSSEEITPIWRVWSSNDSIIKDSKIWHCR